MFDKITLWICGRNKKRRWVPSWLYHQLHPAARWMRQIIEEAETSERQ